MTRSPEENQGVASRIGATHVLLLVLDQGRTLDQALDQTGRKLRLSDQDRRLVHAIVGTVFRRLNRIDAILLRLMDRKKDPSPKNLHQLLRTGIAQVLYLDIAPHAAVHATVSAAASLKLTSRKGLINAVLREAQRQRDALLAEPVDPLSELPEWMVDGWVRDYGESAASDLAQTMSMEAPLDLTISVSTDAGEWAQRLGGETLIKGSVRLPQGHEQVVSLPGFAEGAWWVQDIAASFPVRMLGDISGKSVLDVCAAPGGKTLQLAAAGAEVTALDVSAPRVQRLQDNLRRMNLANRAAVHVADARLWRSKNPFDVILLDAPCSSTGTLRRHPELGRIRGVDAVSDLVAIQRDLLRHASEQVVSGGIIVYVTCSLQSMEGEDQIAAFLKDNSNFKLLSEIPAELSPFLVPGRDKIGFRSWPPALKEKGGMDGFFIACLQRQ